MTATHSKSGKHPALIVRQAEPFNAGPPLSRLCQSAVTPADWFYVRNHGNIPRVDEAGYHLEISQTGGEPVRLSLAELKETLAPVTIPATLQCAGNRRQELMDAWPIAGELGWGAEAIGHAEWSGVRLSDVLRHAGLGREPDSRQHVAFEGLDETERLGGRIHFGGSIPLEKAMGPEVILAHSMNGQPLLPAHGFPLRVVVPGYIGARSVKWLRRIAVQDQPSSNYFQARAYRLFGPDVNADNVVWDTGRMLAETTLTSVICSPGDNERLPVGGLTVQGYAAAAAGGRLVRVEVSTDGGQTWAEAELLPRDEPWTWRLWRVDVALMSGRHELVVRAFDAAGNTQPPDPRQVWNFKGYMNNAWHRVEIDVGA